MSRRRTFEFSRAFKTLYVILCLSRYQITVVRSLRHTEWVLNTRVLHVLSTVLEYSTCFYTFSFKSNKLEQSLIKNLSSWFCRYQIIKESGFAKYFMGKSSSSTLNDVVVLRWNGDEQVTFVFKYRVQKVIRELEKKAQIRILSIIFSHISAIALNNLIFRQKLIDRFQPTSLYAMRL